MQNTKVAAYIRLSKEDEKEGESESVSNQKELIQKYVLQNNLGICEFFIDDGYSGGNFESELFLLLLYTSSALLCLSSGVMVLSNIKTPLPL